MFLKLVLTALFACILLFAAPADPNPSNTPPESAKTEKPKYWGELYEITSITKTNQGGYRIEVEFPSLGYDVRLNRLGSDVPYDILEDDDCPTYRIEYKIKQDYLPDEVKGYKTFYLDVWDLINGAYIESSGMSIEIKSTNINAKP